MRSSVSFRSNAYCSATCPARRELMEYASIKRGAHLRRCVTAPINLLGPTNLWARHLPTQRPSCATYVPHGLAWLCHMSAVRHVSSAGPTQILNTFCHFFKGIKIGKTPKNQNKFQILISCHLKYKLKEEYKMNSK